MRTKLHGIAAVRVELENSNGDTLWICSHAKVHHRSSHRFTTIALSVEFANNAIAGQSNTFGFGRLAWEPSKSSAAVHTEWATQTFRGAGVPAAETVMSSIVDIMERSWYGSLQWVRFLLSSRVL